jgi:hypothetical protein
MLDKRFITLCFSKYSLLAKGLENPCEVISDQFGKIDRIYSAADVNLVVKLNDPAEQGISVEAFEQLVVFEDKRSQTDVLVGIPYIDGNGTPVSQPLLHETALAYCDISLHGGAHGGLTDHTNMMVEVHIMPSVAWHIVDHFQPDRVFGRGFREMSPAIESCRGYAQFYMLEIILHHPLRRRTTRLIVPQGPTGFADNDRSAWARWPTEDSAVAVRFRFRSSSAMNFCATSIKEVLLAAIAISSSSVMDE